MKKLFLTVLFVMGFAITQAQAHCEIPCGIYGDGERFTEMMEHAQTIEKSMNEINKLSNQEKPDYHMISRWTTNKEEHAKEIQHIIAQYFLAQRVALPKKDASPDDIKDYETHTVLLHHILVRAMKTKQTTDIATVETLRMAVEAYKKHYFKDHGHAH